MDPLYSVKTCPTLVGQTNQYVLVLYLLCMHYVFAKKCTRIGFNMHILNTVKLYNFGHYLGLQKLCKN